MIDLKGKGAVYAAIWKINSDPRTGLSSEIIRTKNGMHPLVVAPDCFFRYPVLALPTIARQDKDMQRVYRGELTLGYAKGGGYYGGHH